MISYSNCNVTLSIFNFNEKENGGIKVVLILRKVKLSSIVALLRVRWWPSPLSLMIGCSWSSSILCSWCISWCCLPSCGWISCCLLACGPMGAGVSLCLACGTGVASSSVWCSVALSCLLGSWILSSGVLCGIGRSGVCSWVAKSWWRLAKVGVCYCWVSTWCIVGIGT